MSNQPFKRFRQVQDYVDSSRGLYRSSSPNYIDGGAGDPSQNLDDKAVKFLVDNKITSIISFNSIEYKKEWKDTLTGVGISYTWLQVVDYTSPDIPQLQKARDTYLGAPKGSRTLIHCGAGYGRTGTGVSGIQLLITKGVNLPNRAAWQSANNVETEKQLLMLEDLQKKILNGTIS